MIELIRSAKRTKSPWNAKPRGNSPATWAGLRFEKAAWKALGNISLSLAGRLEHNPWYEYTADERSVSGIVYTIGHFCSPDFLLWFGNNSQALYIIEVKLTYLPGAATKIRDLYTPVVRLAHGLSDSFPIHSVVLAHNLTPDVTVATDSLSEAAARNIPLHWLGRGGIRL